ncbi:hypothetical protein D1013_12045 [Euzebyella marina]|uniref:DUF4738 domain-containing protein n=1 Tax=Euzebyella marina TaxID=1761453 RepID=A0A3G2L791_9FLAO|nr:hypothetical protein [Euzebyella marina]AYN68051.1 hypothetical protein D1013_12045 [Euzebyella marina]
MKYTKQILFSCLLMVTGVMCAQGIDREISEETTEKKYEMYEEGKLVKKSVKIHTVVKQDIKFAEEDEDKIDARRVITPKKIFKTVSIDNDTDEDYDEVLKFSYTSEANKDFLFGTNDNEIFKALENSKYLNVGNKENMTEKSLNSLIVITDDNGQVVELVLEKHEEM